MSRLASLRRLLLASTVTVLAGGLAGAAAAQSVALPSGGSVAAGSATISQQGNATTIRQTSGRAIINWQSFSIGTGGKVTVDQPGSSSALLNRVTGGDISKIAGSLTSNGQVFLINRNGIVVTPSGQITATGGFIGSTLDIADQDFMNGKLAFAGRGAGVVVNQGYIAGGAVALLGARVDNQGVIVSPLGRVALGSGQQATLDLNGDGVLQVAIPSDITDADGKPLIANSGLIDAAGGIIMLKVATAKEIVRQAINMSGVIRATQVSADGGDVLLDGGDGGLVTITSGIDASGMVGGRIDITGGNVSLTGATLSATGTSAGGLVRVGGAFQGGQARSSTSVAVADLYTTRFGALPMLATAQTVTVDRASSIDVSGSASGGTAILWSAQNTAQAGTIRASAGSNGTGGGVEISSLGALTTALSQVHAGFGGTILLDPKNVTVDDGQFPPSDGSSEVLTTDIATQLEAGTNVLVQASNDITWNSNLTVDPTVLRAGTLHLSAGRSIEISAYLTLAEANLVAIANDSVADGIVDADRDPGAASITTFDGFIAGTLGSGGTGGNVTLTVAGGAGLTNNTVGYSRLGNIEGRTVTIDSGSQRMAFFASTEPGHALDPVGVKALDAVTLTGAIQAASGGLTVSGNTVNWTNEATAALTAPSYDVPISFVENGVTTRSGVLQPNNNARLALGAGGTAPQYSAQYGAAYPAFAALHLVSGSLHGTDTLASILTDGSTATTGPAAGAGGGNYAVVTTAQSGFGFASGADGYFVDLRTASDTLHITQNILTPTVITGLYTYGSPAAVVTLSGLLGSDTTNLTATVSGLSGAQLLTPLGNGYAFASTLGAGNRSFTLTGLTGGQSANYSLDLSGTITANLTINPKALTYIGGTYQTTYGTTASPAFQLDGVIGSDAVATDGVSASLNGGTVTLGARSPVGTYSLAPVSLAGAAAANYVLAGSGNSNGTLTVSPKALTYTAVGASSTYGTLASVATPTLSGVLGGDDVRAATLLGGTALTLTARTAAGSYAITPALVGAAAVNYTVAASGNSGASLVIAPLAMGFTVNNVSQVYSTPGALVRLTGILAGDIVEPDATLDGGRTFYAMLGNGSYGYATAGVGSHDFALTGITGSDAGNYRIDLSATHTATLTVTPKPITYSVSSVTSTYGSSNSQPVATFSGTVDGAVSAAVVVTNPAFPGVDYPLTTMTPAGVYSLSVAANSLTGYGAQNYMIASSGNTNGTLTINPRAITYIARNANSTYGTTATPTASLIGVLGNDFVTPIFGLYSGGSAIAFGSRTPAGTYSLAVSSLNGADASSYFIAAGGNINGVLTIAPKPVSYTIGDANSTYGTVATPRIYVDGVLPDDDVAGIPYAGASPLSALTNSGTYTLSVGALSGAASGNYSIAATGNSTGLLGVFAKPISATIAAASSIYGNPLVFAAPTFSGLVDGGDPAPVVTQALHFPLMTNGRAAAGTYLIDPTASGSSNYIVNWATSAVGSYTITKKQLFATVEPGTNGNIIAYGLTPAGLTFSADLTGALSGDDVGALLTYGGLSLSTGGHINVGSYAIGVGQLIGAASDNYIVAHSSGATLTIVPRAVNGTPNLTASSTYGTVPTLPGVNAPVTGLQSGDQVSVGAVGLDDVTTPVAVTAQTPAKSYYIVATGLTGADAANYNFQSPILGSYTIKPKPLTYIVGNANSVYGTAALLPSASLSGIVGNDAVAPVIAALSATLDAGTHAIALSALDGAQASNYAIAATGNTLGVLTVSPKTLSYALSSPGQIAYGDTIDPTQARTLTLSGVLPGDTVTAQLFATVTGAPAGDVYSPVGTTVPVYATTALGVADYNLTLAYRPGATNAILGGQSAFNYVLPVAGAAVPLTVTPRAITYAVTAQSAYTNGGFVYGDTPPIAASFTNLATGLTPDYQFVRDGTVQLGRVTTLDAYTSAGGHSLGVALNGADVFNYSLSGSPLGIVISPKYIYASQASSNATYGTEFDDLIAMPGVLKGDDVAPVIVTRGATLYMIPTANGYGIAQVLNDVTTGQAFSVTGLTGAAKSNYILVNGVSGSFNILPKPITYSTAGFSAQYGGYSLPPSYCASYCLMEATDNQLQTGAVTLNGVLASDAGFVSGVSYLAANGGSAAYARTTAAGSYQQIVGGLQGSKAMDYTVATVGNKPGTATIIPAYLQVAVSDGAILYNGVAGSNYSLVGTPGVVTLTRSGDPTPASAMVSSSDNVSVVLQLQDSNGKAETASVLPIGSYIYQPVGLTGQGADNYQILPFTFKSGTQQNPVSTAGTLTVADLSVFNFAYLGSNPNATIYVPPPATVNPPAQQAHTFQDATSSSSGDSSASYNMDVGASLTVRATANAGVSTSTSAGNALLTAGLDSTASMMAQFGATGIYVGANASAGGSLTVSSGPGYLTVGAGTSTSGAITIDPTTQELMIDGQVRAAVSATGGAAGALGSGVSGNASSTSTAFVQARSNTDFGLSNTAIDEFVGAGVSTGATAGLSGGGVAGSMGVTVYSPGSLYIGARSVSDLNDGTFTLSMTIGISIGIGGIELKPSISFPVAPIVDTATNVYNAWAAVLTGHTSSAAAPPPCDTACAAAQYTAEMTKKAQTAYSLGKGSGAPTIDMMAYLNANPDVVAWAQQEGRTTGFGAAVANAETRYSSLTSLLTSTIESEQAIARKLATNPASLTAQDVAQAVSLRQEEQDLAGMVKQLGGKLQVANGQITMVNN